MIFFFSRILFLSEFIHFLSTSLFHVYSEKFSWITLSGSLFITSGFLLWVSSMKTFTDFYFSVNLLLFSSVSLFHVSSEKFSWITLSGALFISSGFVPCFLYENFQEFYSVVNLIHFSSASLFHVSSMKFFMDFFLSEFYLSMD